MYYNNSQSYFTYAMGGGGGGALAWINDVTVTPGESISIQVGGRGADGAYSTGSTKVELRFLNIHLQ